MDGQAFKDWTYWPPSASLTSRMLGHTNYGSPIYLKGYQTGPNEVHLSTMVAEGGYLREGFANARDPRMAPGSRQIKTFETLRDINDLVDRKVARLTKPILYVRGMHGLGDNFHQRALVRKWLAKGYEVYLETSWHAPYWDLIGEDFHVVCKPSALRTQGKNAIREQELFWKGPTPQGPHVREDRVWWRANDVRQTGSVLGAMLRATRLEDVDPDTTDFRMPIKPEWDKALQERAKLWPSNVGHKPIMVFRPLVARTEWTGCETRNPDHQAYASLFTEIRKHFYVISIADLEPKKEWIVGPDCSADLRLHKGELPVELLCALMARASMVYASPGFAIVMAQAVGTPVVCVFGGYENSTSFTAGAKYVPYMGVDTTRPCQCFIHVCKCPKQIDLQKWAPLVRGFAEASITRKMRTNDCARQRTREHATSAA